MSNINEWDASEKPSVSTRDAAIAVAKSLGYEEAVAVFESAAAVGVEGQLSVVLPPNRLESLSKGRGWARLGSGNSMRRPGALNAKADIALTALAHGLSAAMMVSGASARTVTRWPVSRSAIYFGSSPTTFEFQW